MNLQIDILDRVTQAVARYPGPLKQLAQEAGVGRSWLEKFARGEIPNPGVNQITKLAKHFNAGLRKPTEKKLDASIQP